MSKPAWNQRATGQEIIDAYQRTGSVWRAGKELGIAGQTVHERLVALGYPLAGRNWDDAEIEELKELADKMPLNEIAQRLGRPYYGVAMKVSRLGIGVRYGNKQKRKLPRGAGYDKASCLRYTKEIERSGSTVHQYARRTGLSVEMICRAMEQHYPDWWQAYRAAHSDLPEIECEYCQQTFVPSTKKQRFCARRCADVARRDESYFGGKRSQTIGLAEGICQLCLQTKSSLSSHHVYGKENDPENEVLVALCRGCHQIVTILGGRPFLDLTEGWERLIQLTHFRRNGHARPDAVWTCVEIEQIEDLEDTDS